MEQATSRQKRQNPLARQTASSSTSFRAIRLVGFGSQAEEFPADAARGQRLQGIPSHRDYAPDAPANRETRQSQFGSSHEPERPMMIDLPRLDTGDEDLTAAEGFASDIRWRKFVQASGENRIDSIIGIFKDEPLMEALMERIREDRRLESEASL